MSRPTDPATRTTRATYTLEGRPTMLLHRHERGGQFVNGAPRTVETAPGYRVRQFMELAKRSVSHPRWFLESFRLASRSRKDARRRFALDDFREFLVGQREAIAAVLGVPITDCDAAIALASRHRSRGIDGDGIMAAWDASGDLTTKLGAIVYLMRPSVVVETGVARGATSATILAMMRDRGHGHLHSIDLPSLLADSGEAVGSAIPQELRDRWTLHLGPSRQILRPLLRSLGSIDIFLHDADHTYTSQMEEYRAAWPHLKSNGLLLSDDVRNPAFVEFAEEIGQRPYIVLQAGKPHPYGIIVKR